MANHNQKLGKKEQVLRADGATAVYQYMIDPTMSAEELEACKKIDYAPGRWVIVDVIPAPKSV